LPHDESFFETVSPLPEKLSATGTSKRAFTIEVDVSDKVGNASEHHVTSSLKRVKDVVAGRAFRRLFLDSGLQVTVRAVEPGSTQIPQADMQEHRDAGPAAGNGASHRPPMPDLTSVEVAAVVARGKERPWSKRPTYRMSAFEWVKDTYGDWIPGLLQSHPASIPGVEMARRRHPMRKIAHEDSMLN
jgi:hypothetical protein